MISIYTMKQLQAEQKQYQGSCTVQVCYIPLQPVLTYLIQPIQEVEDRYAGHFMQRNTQAQYVASSIATEGITAHMLPTAIKFPQLCVTCSG